MKVIVNRRISIFKNNKDSFGVAMLSFRLKSFFTHLSVSAFVGVVSLALVFLLWYPAPLNKASGVNYVVLVLLGVDLVLGPVLTLILAKKGKKGLLFDLVVVVIIQVSAYFYGMSEIANARPVWIAFDTFRMELVQANSLDLLKSDKASEGFNYKGWSGPKWVAVRAARGDKEKSDRLFYELELGFAPSMRPELYEPLDNAWQNMKLKSNPLSDLSLYNDAITVQKILEAYPVADAYLPLLSPEVDMAVLLDVNNNKIVDIVDLRPW